MEEIAEAQQADAFLKHLLECNAVIDQGLEIKLVEKTTCVCKDGQLVIPKPLQLGAVKLYHHYLQHPGHTHLEECCKPPRYVPYKCTYVPYDGTFGASNQG